MTISSSPERGDRIRELRIKNNLTIQQLADCLDIDKSTLSRYESGKTGKINQATLEKLAIILGTTYEYLQFGKATEVSADGLSDRIEKDGNEDVLHSLPVGYAKATEALKQMKVYSAQELSDAVSAGQTPVSLFTFKMHDGSMLPRIGKGDLLLVQPCSELTAGKVNVLLSADKEIIVRDVEKQDGHFLVKRRDGGDIMILDAENRRKHIKQVIGFCLCFQASEI